MKLRIGVSAAAVTLAGLGGPALAAVTSDVATAAPAAAAGEPPVAITGPSKVVLETYDGKVYDLGVRLEAPTGQPFEIRSTRADWSSPIRTFWQSPSGPVEFRKDLQTKWSGLDKFLKVSIVWRKDGSTVYNRRVAPCLNTYDTQRTNPDAPIRNPYPESCSSHPYTRGSVQGIQGGWRSLLPLNENGVKLQPGKYDVTETITPAYARTLGLSPAQAAHTYQLVVKKGQEESRMRPRMATPRATHERARPAPRPTAQRAGARSDAEPDLQSLPAYGMTLSKNSKWLRFSATVWNGGNGPMVVDGFRRGESDVMDAYQYFIDTDGNQTGYQKVGTMIWHNDPTHYHWHFTDFARYSLLRADKTEAVRSKKESFCLANTDAIDYTVPGADWRPENTDLQTDCGDRSSTSIREVLAAGSGDTYAQFRAGQSFRVDNLPNGVYYVAVQANPNGKLIESDSSNNRALRKIKLTGTPTHRKLKVYQVGIIDDSGYGEEEY